METKNYLLLARSGDGFMHEKVNLLCDLDTAKSVLKLMMQTSPRLVRGEIIDGNRTHTGDFRNKPCVFIYRDENTYTEEKSWR